MGAAVGVVLGVAVGVFKMSAMENGVSVLAPPVRSGVSIATTTTTTATATTTTTTTATTTREERNSVRQNSVNGRRALGELPDRDGAL